MKTLKRPESLDEVAQWSFSEEEFGRNLADFEHALQRLRSRPALAKTISEPPRLLARQFPTGNISDAWLASYAEELAFRFKLSYPNWIWEPDRFLDHPWHQDAQTPRLRIWHTLKSPASFTRRNLFVDINLPPIKLTPGRPRKSAAHKREMNRLRVARHRERKGTPGG